MELQYFGWSSLVVRCCDVSVGFDVSGGRAVADALRAAATAVLCVTHGHPDHVAGTRRLMNTGRGDRRLSGLHLVSSAPIIGCVSAGNRRADITCHPLCDREAISVNGVRLTAFCWTHAPLLPAGLGPKLAYVTRFAHRPVDAIGIVHSTVGLPLRAPTLGFHVRFPCGFSLINYAEGLHHRTDPCEVEAVASETRAEMALFAVEPEDVACLPQWADLLSVRWVVLYEAHRPWRERFGLPTVDLHACAHWLSSRFPQVRVDTLGVPGQTIADRGPACGQ